MEVERGYIRTVLPPDVLDADVERDSEGYLGGLASNTSERPQTTGKTTR